MALPTKAKTWTVNPCNSVTYTSYAQLTGDIFLGVKNNLLLMAGVTVKGSCNGTTGAMDGVDRWSTSGAIQTQGTSAITPQSWMVLDLADMGGTELLLSYGNNSNTFTVAYSPGGLYTIAATATHKPTATDEVIIGNGVAFVTASVANLWTTWTASDGSALYFATAQSGTWTRIACVQLITSRVEVGTFSPTVAGFCIPGSAATFNSWNTAAPACRLNPGTGVVNISGYFGSEGVKYNNTAGALYTQISELQGGGHNIYPVSFWSETATARGAVGNWIDLWAGNVNATDGDTYPNDSSRTFIHVGDFILPWGGSAPVMA